MIEKLNRIIALLLIIIVFALIGSVILMELNIINPKYTTIIFMFCLSYIIILAIIVVLIILFYIVKALDIQRIKLYKKCFPYNKEIAININRSKMIASKDSLCYEKKRVLELSKNESNSFFLIRHAGIWTQDTIEIKCCVDGNVEIQQVYYEAEPYGWIEYIEKDFYSIK